MNNDVAEKPQRDERGQFLPGHTGMGGRNKGSRPKLCEAFIADFYAVWEVAGKEAIEKTAATDPAAFVRIAAGLLPKEYKIETSSDLTDEQLDSRIREILDTFGDALGLTPGAGRPSEREEAPARPDPAVSVSTLQ